MCLGIPGKIVSVSAQNIAMVDVGGVQRKVDITCVNEDPTNPEALVGEWVLVHVGFAMSKIDAQEAAATLALMETLGELQEDIDAYENSEARDD